MVGAPVTAIAPARVGVRSVALQRRHNAVSWWYGYAVCCGLALALAALTITSDVELFAPAAVVVLAGMIVCLAKPTWGVYFTVALALLGDSSIFPSYPFTKNLSSRESVLFVDDGLPVSPLDLLIAALVCGWLASMLATRQWRLRRGRLFAPVAVLAAFTLVGLVWGLGRGGAPIVAYWEIRPLLYLFTLFVLITNLLDRPAQYRRLLWMVMVVIGVNALGALRQYAGLSVGEREDLESLGEHGAAVQGGLLVVFALATWLFTHRGLSGRWLLVPMAVAAGWAMLLSERRAAMVGLFAAVVLVMIVLRWHHRARFWSVLPVLLIGLVGYLGAFWNSEGAIGLPAAAAKSVIGSEEQSPEDQASDLYRVVERFNINATISANPVLGVGFGERFLMPAPLPNISFFVFWEYITHNSILWIWMKAGIGGFLAMLMVFATALRSAARVLRKPAEGAATVVTLTSVAYVVMFAVFAFVDIAWDTRNVVLLAVCLAQIDRAARVVDRTEGERAAARPRRRMRSVPRIPA